MIQKEYEILRQTLLAEGIYQMDIKAPEIAQRIRPGQFVNLYSKDASRLLPRPISVHNVYGDELSLIYAVVGKGTEEFSRYNAGEKLRIVGPLGNGFPLEAAENADEVLLVGGGLGIPPMLFTAKQLQEELASVLVTTILGFRSMPWISDAFVPYSRVLCASDDGACGFQGTVVDRIKDYLSSAPAAKRILFACGPIPMMKALQAHQEDWNMEMWFSLEERMGCGYGACYGCPARTVQGLKRVCKDGPVFRGKDVIFS